MLDRRRSTEAMLADILRCCPDWQTTGAIREAMATADVHVKRYLAHLQAHGLVEQRPHPYLPTSH